LNEVGPRGRNRRVEARTQIIIVKVIGIVRR
jgi:hypothetical protein